MKILQINATYNIGSTGRIVADLHKKALERGYESYVGCAISNDENNKIIKIGNTLDHKVHALLCRISGKQGYFSKGATKEFLEIADKIEPDIIHIHNLHSNYINLNALLDYVGRKNIALVMTLHDCWFFTGKCFHYTVANCKKWKENCGHCPKRALDTPAYIYDSTERIIQDKRNLYSRIQKLYVVGVSKWIAEEAKQSILQKAKISYCHNGVDLQVFHPVCSSIRKENGISENAFVLLCMANKYFLNQNLRERRAIESMLQEDMVLVVLGSDLESSNNDHIIYVPRIKDDSTMVKWYSAADAFVNLTWEDSLPFVNIEALACGTPVISHKTSGASETVDCNTGILITPGSEKELLAAIDMIKRNGKKEYVENCVRRAASLFNSKNSYDEYFNIYREIFNDIKKDSSNCSD